MGYERKNKNELDPRLKLCAKRLKCISVSIRFAAGGSQAAHRGALRPPQLAAIRRCF